jgi:pyrroloquinoline quinone biosynthesis protein E
MTTSERAYALIAELTYKCPLGCVYCSNPLDLGEHPDSLQTHDWIRVIRQAEELGVLQVLLSGGEPLLRRDLELIVEGAAAAGLYTNLITSGIPLSRDRLARLKSAGLDAVQISIQGVDARSSEAIAGRPSFDRKLEAAAWVKELGLPLTLNVVLHRGNLNQIEQIVHMAEELRADRLELANAQYLAWALLNRDQLMPTRDQIEEARRAARAAKQRLQGTMEILFVLPDYYSDLPKACMSGWAQRYIVVSPDGFAMPCHLAHSIAGMRFDNVRERTLEAIWHDSSAFQAFRGEGWMSEPCSSCERRAIDFGGCRCQAFHLTGDARATDPACALSPAHEIVRAARASAGPLLEVSRLIHRRAESPRGDVRNRHGG